MLKFIPSQQPQAAADDGGAPAAPQRIRAPMGHDNSWWWDAVNEGKIPIQSCNGVQTYNC